ncbi:hypothetical protein AURANDRAFT_69278, partial [Aureococcus anophagefferens]
ETACWSCRAADECDAAGDGCAWVGGDYPFCDTNHACEAATCFACGLDECAGVDGCMLDAPRGGPGAADYFRPSCTAFRECSGDYDCWACAEAECGAADGCEWLGDYCAEACGAGKCHVCGEGECEARSCDLVDASDLFAGADDDFRPKLCVESCSPTNCYFCLEDDCDATDGCMRHEGLCVEARDCSPDHCWACGTGEACAAAGCAVVEDADGADLCVDPRCDDCESCGEGACQRACRASETCELYEGDPALLGASFACARPDACVPYYACANCDEDLCAVGYVPGCKLSADAKRCEADDAALACSNVNCGACGAGAACDALLLCSTTPFGTCAQDLSFLEDGMGPCRAELCELCPVPQLCDAAPGCAFGDACGKDEAYYGCGAQACGPASCALCATASACDAVPGCASQSLPGAGDLCAVDLAAGFLAPACSRDACYACDVAACAATPGCAYDDQTGACGFDCGADGGGVVFESDARRCYALVLRGAWQDRALAVFDGAAALVAAGEKRTSAHVRDDLCLGDGCYRVDVSGGRPGVFAPCFWTLGPA